MLSNGWRRFLLIGSVVLVLSLPFGASVVDVTAVAGVVAAIACLEIGLRRWRPEHPGPWRGMQAATAGFLIGNLLRALGLAVSSPNLADALELASYAVAVHAVWRIGRVRAYRRDPTSLIDAIIGVGGLGVVVWLFLMVPYLTNPELSVADRAISVAFSMLSLSLATFIARLAIGDGVRNPAYYLLAVAGAGGIASDVVTSIGLAPNGGALAWQSLAAAALTTVTFVGLGASALHPSMRDLVMPATEPLPSMTRRRLLAMTVAALIAPVSLLAHIGPDRPFTAPVVVVLWMLVSSLVMVRVAGLVRSRDRGAAHDRVLGAAAHAMLVSPDGDLDAVVRGAARELVGPEADVVVPAIVAVDQLGGLAPGQVDQLASGRRVSARTMAGLPVALQACDYATMSPLVIGGRLRGVLVVATDRQLSPEAAAACDRLAREAALASERAELMAEAHRQRGERRFKALVEGSTDVILQVDDTGVVTLATPACVDLLGLTEGQTVGRRLAELVETADQGVLAGLVRRALVEGAAGPVELRCRHTERGAHWCEAVASDRTADPVVGGLVLTLRDIEERKMAEQRLSRSEARFRSLVQHSSDVVAVLDDDLIVNYVSPSLQRVLGLDADSLVDRELLTLVHPDDRGRFEAAVAGLAPDGEPLSRMELLVRDSAGAWRTLDVTISDLRAHHAVRGIVLNAHDVSERKELELDLAHQALYDDLTGLANRALFRQRVAAALSRRDAGRSEVAVMLLDLDEFKTVNDSLGHTAGDELLTAVARRLASAVRGQDTIARLGGDEFAILVQDAARSAVLPVVERVRGALRAPFSVAGRELTIDGSIGVAYANDDSIDMVDLLRNADTAMYAAKRRGKGRVEIFDDSMHAQVTERLELKNDLVQVLARDQLLLYYQPLIDLRTGRVKGFEALSRWNHPTRGLVSPASFVPLAEESGLIIPITSWVLETSLRQLAAWRRRLHDDTLTMSVNLSARQLDEDDDAHRTIDAILRRYGLPAEALEMELTESLNVDVDSADIQRRLAAITALGVGLAADDFGTGFASYAAVQKLPYSCIKIDRKLIAGLADVTDERARVQIRSIIEMAHAADMKVVAEGVEGAEQLSALKRLHCDVGQGYYFCRPVPAQEAERLLDEDHGDLLRRAMSQSRGQDRRPASVVPSAPALVARVRQ